MKRLVIIIAATPIVLLSACASIQTSTEGASATGTTSASHYCWKDRLHTSGNDLVCNWADTRSEACRETSLSRLSKDALATEPAAAKRCDNGQWLVQVTRK